MAETIENLFIYIATYSPLLPIAIFLVFFSSNKLVGKNRILLLITTYSLIEFSVNFTTFWVSAKFTKIMYSFFTAIEYGFFVCVLFSLIRDKLSQKILIFSSAGFYVFWTLYKIFGRYRVLDSIPIGVETILILLFAFRYLYEQMDKVEDGFIYNRFPFWIVAGIMLYLAGSFFCYLFANQVDAKTRNVFWMFQNVFATLKCIFFATSILIFQNQLQARPRLRTPRLSY